MDSQKSDADTPFNVFLGSGIGVLKGVYFGPDIPKLKNFHVFNHAEKITAITHLSWANEGQEDLLVAYKDHTIKTYSRKLKMYTQGIQLDVGDKNKIVGLDCIDGNYVVGLDDGRLVLWDFESDSAKLDIQTGKHMSKARQCPIDKSLFATGGNDNDVKIWNLETTSPQDPKPIFKSKNVPHDFLDLRVPVWPQDLVFMPRTSDVIAMCSRYGHVRLYDTKVDNKGRPVINMEFLDHPLMAISPTRNDSQVVVGSAQGIMGLIDLRYAGKGRVVRHFDGPVGGVRSISAHPTSPYFVSCGLDRHLYLHQLDQRKPIKKMYLKSQLNCVLITDDFNLDGDYVTKKQDSESVWQNISMDSINPKIIKSKGKSTLPPSKRMKNK